MGRASTKAVNDARLRELVECVRAEKQAQLVEEDGEVVAVIIPAEDLDLYRNARRRVDESLALFEHIQGGFRSDPIDEDDEELERVLNEVREETRERHNVAKR